MTISRKLWLLSCLAPLLLLPSLSQALVTSENFDSGWTPAPPQLSLTNGSNSSTGWASTNTQIYSSFGSNTPPYAARLGTGGWVRSGLLTNGAGTLIFWLRASVAGGANRVAVETSTDGSTWYQSGNDYSNTVDSFSSFTNVINTEGNLYVRLRRTTAAAGSPVIDTITISDLPVLISITNITISPALPTDNDPVTVSANIDYAGNPIVATNYWRQWPGTSWTAIPMLTNASGKFETSTPIPAQTFGSIVEYKIGATSGSAANSSSVRSYTIRPQSGFTNMLVTGQINTNLLLGANHSWQNFITLSNAINPTFRFQGYSNAISTLWGDTNPTASNIPAYGTAEINATNIMLAGTNTGTFVFSFNESNLSYNVMACDAINFNSWTSAAYSTYGNHTNEGWIVSGGSTTDDTSTAFSGRSLILNGQQGAATNTYLLSPLQTNGIGQISFWYRNWSTTASPVGNFSVQVATNPVAGPWTTIASITNAISTNYLFASIGRYDRVNQYVRILNNPDGTTSRLCLDNVVIARPGAGVSATWTNSPSDPSITNTVVISATFTPQSGAVVTNAILWFRMGTNGGFTSSSMTNTSPSIWASAPIPQAAPGPVQYAIQCFFSGFQSESASPIWFPSIGTNSPASYQVTDNSNTRFESFDSNWIPTLLQTNYASGTNPLTGWLCSTTRINSAFASVSPSNGASLAVNGWLQSTQLVGGIGTLTFWAKYTGSIKELYVEVSGDGTTWTTNEILSINTPNYALYSSSINSSSNLFIRLRRLSTLAGFIVIDDIHAPFPPSDILVTNVFLKPGYPAASDTVALSCDVTSLNPYFPAWNIRPALYYRLANTSTFTPIPMARLSGTTYSTAPFSIPAFPRDTTVYYYIACEFSGYFGSPVDNRSPRYYPASGSNAPSSYTVYQFASSFSNVSAIVNGQPQTARQLSDNTWQAIANISSATNRLAFSFSGSGYSTGFGYATNLVSWGNSNNWQTALPLSDNAVSNHSAFAITGSFAAGQYLLRFDEATGQYLIIPCIWQDFNSWADNGTTYKLTENSGNEQPLVQSFDSWPTNTPRTHSDSFDSGNWPDIDTYTNGILGGSDFYVIYGSKITSSSVQTDPSSTRGNRWVAHLSDGSATPFRGIESISYAYRVQSSTNPIVYTNTSIGVYLMPTNAPHAPNYFDLTQTSIWQTLVTHVAVTNTSFRTNTVTLKTNDAFNVIFSNDAGTNSAYFDLLTITEWYSQTFSDAGWLASNAWSESKSEGDNILRLEASRANSFGSPQFVQTPLITNGINSISFEYSGITTNVSFDIQVAYGTPTTWSNRVQVTNSTVTGGTSDYITVAYTLLIPPTNVYLRINNTTPKPGALLLNAISLTPYVQGFTWRANNAAMSTDNSSDPRNYYHVSAYLNSNRTANISTTPGFIPDTNAFPHIRSRQISGGIGEISFWYRNWALSAPIRPAKLVIQTSLTDSTNNAAWTTVSVITNIVNTNDYAYYRTSVYDTTSQYVRIYNEDTNNTAGRVCIDDILVTTPWASTLTMSNLVVSPSIPLHTNTVDIMVDVCRLFWNPSNITLTAIYGAATSHNGLASAPVTNLTMTCIASNMSVQGKWYRYKTTTPIPAHAIDTFVKYSTKATFSGLHTEITSPKTNKLFGVYPYWYDPLNATYGTNQAYYIVFSCPTGIVWFNEVNYMDGGAFDYQFVELCGLAGLNIKDWSIEIRDGDNNFVASYIINTNYTLQNETNGHGFWLLGKSTIPNIDRPLTHLYMDGDWLNGESLPAYNGGRLALLRSCGAAEHRISYQRDGSSAGYPYIGRDDWDYYGDGTLGMRGSGTNAQDFFWQEQGGQTPGYGNAGQDIFGLAAQVIIDPPTIAILSLLVNTNVWIQCNTTNNWYPVPWYTTNLMISNSWTTVTNFNYSIANFTNCTINFAKPTNSPTYFFTVEATNSP